MIINTSHMFSYGKFCKVLNLTPYYAPNEFYQHFVRIKIYNSLNNFKFLNVTAYLYLFE